MLKKIALSVLLLSVGASSLAFAADNGMCYVNFTTTNNPSNGWWKKTCLNVVMYKQSTGAQIGFPLGYFSAYGNTQQFHFPCPDPKDYVSFRIDGINYPTSDGTQGCVVTGSAAALPAMMEAVPVYGSHIFGPYYSTAQYLASNTPATPVVITIPQIAFGNSSPCTQYNWHTEPFQLKCGTSATSETSAPNSTTENQ